MTYHKDNPNLITIAEAARLANVSKQNIHSIIKKNKAGENSYLFYVELDGRTWVDIKSREWHNYCLEKRDPSLNEGKKKLENENLKIEKQRIERAKKDIKRGKEKPDKKINIKKEKTEPKQETLEKLSLKKITYSDMSEDDIDDLVENEAERQKNSLTGSFDPANMIPTSPQQLKAMTDIQKAKLEMEVRLDELIDINIFVGMVESLTRGLDGFVSLGRSVSGKICVKLERIGMEKEVEKIINDTVEKTMQLVKKRMAQSIKLETYIHETTKKKA